MSPGLRDIDVYRLIFIFTFQVPVHSLLFQELCVDADALINRDADIRGVD